MPPGSFLRHFPELSQAIADVRQAAAGTDFDVIAAVLAKVGQFARIASDLRHYLDIAFATFQRHFDQCFPLSWPWADWMRQYAASITMVITLNYDRVVENGLELAGIPYGRVGIFEERGVPVLKPHGSIDFAPAIPGLVLNSDVPQMVIPPEGWLKPRREWSIVLPTETSPQSDLQWIAPGYERIRQLGPTWTHLIIAGISYWECDRPEIDFIIDSMAQGAVVVVANPRPPEELLNKVKAGGRRLEVWADGPAIL